MVLIQQGWESLYSCTYFLFTSYASSHSLPPVLYSYTASEVLKPNLLTWARKKESERERDGKKPNKPVFLNTPWGGIQEREDSYRGLHSSTHNTQPSINMNQNTNTQRKLVFKPREAIYQKKVNCDWVYVYLSIYTRYI